MSDNGEIEVESPAGYPVLPKDVTEEIGSIKLFNKVCSGTLQEGALPGTAQRLTLRSGPTRRSRSATSRSRTFPNPHPHSVVRAHIEYLH